MIPRRLFRIWLGSAPIGARFEEWWTRFQVLHPGWEAFTLRDADVERFLPAGSPLRAVFDDYTTRAGQSDILRLAAVHALGGVYVDHDCLPLRPLDPLLDDPRAFAGKRSSKSLNNSVIGGPAGHAALADLLAALPAWYWADAENERKFPHGPTFLTAQWWDRPDVRLLPVSAFYSKNRNFKTAVERRAVEQSFVDETFPADAFLCHWSDHKFGSTR